MIPLKRIRVRPCSPWRTPWQADTLLGSLCATAARVHGADFLRQRLVEPMLAGRPPFVLSDAFPGDLLPVPVTVRLCRPPEDADRKKLKRGRWVTLPHFLGLRTGATNGQIPWAEFKADADVFWEETTRHNTLARDSDGSLEDGGLFARPDLLLQEPARPGQPASSAARAAVARREPPAEDGGGCLTIYFRTADDAAAELLLELLYELSLVGFGADVATGRGQFELLSEPEEAAELDAAPAQADGVIVLSTFQPGPNDSLDGFWEAFAKFGKLGPDLGVRDVRKHTLIMFRPGACFRTDPGRPFVGHTLFMELFLPPPALAELRARGTEVVHPAYGLTIPARLGPLADEAA